MTQSERVAFTRSFHEFMEREGIRSLSTHEYPEDVVEPHFSWLHCDCCGGIAGNRYDAAGFNPTTREVQTGYKVCEDCIYFAEYGELPGE